MNIFVCVKQVPDTETRIKLTGDASGIEGVDAKGMPLKFIVSPYDEFAIEESLRLRDKNPGSTVTVVSAGPGRVTDAIRTALAMGADHGVQIELPEGADSAMAADALAAALKKEPAVDIVFTGKEAIDDGAAQVSQILAEKLGFGCATVVLAAEYGAGLVKCRREVEGGSIEVIEVGLPAVIAAQKGLNEPRYASLPNIMKAKKKEIRMLKAADLGVSEANRKIRLKNFQLPPPKPPGRKLSGDPAAQAKELARLLHEEAKVI